MEEKNLNKKILIGLPAVIVLLATIFFYIAVPQSRGSVPGKIDNGLSSIFYSKDSGGDKPCCVEISSGKYSENSIYQLDAEWTDRFGRKMKLGNLKGEKVILTMFYASCTTACPVMVSYMQNLEKEIHADKLPLYRFVLVTIDPSKDTPAKLNQYAKEHNLEPEHWTLLTGSKEDIASLSELIGFNYKQNQSGMFSHTNLISFLDDKGEIVHQSAGLNQNLKKLAGML